MSGLLHALVEDAAREAGVTVAQMLGGQRHRHVVSARWRAIRRAYEEGFTSTQIAHVIGLDPSTVRHAIDAGDVPHANTGRGPRYPLYPHGETGGHKIPMRVE